MCLTATIIIKTHSDYICIEMTSHLGNSPNSSVKESSNNLYNLDSNSDVDTKILSKNVQNSHNFQNGIPSSLSSIEIENIKIDDNLDNISKSNNSASENKSDIKMLIPNIDCKDVNMENFCDKTLENKGDIITEDEIKDSLYYIRSRVLVNKMCLFSDMVTIDDLEEYLSDDDENEFNFEVRFLKDKIDNEKESKTEDEQLLERRKKRYSTDSIEYIPEETKSTEDIIIINQPKEYTIPEHFTKYKLNCDLPEEYEVYRNAPSPFKDPHFSEDVQMSIWSLFEITICFNNLSRKIPDVLMEDMLKSCGGFIGWSRSWDKYEGTCLFQGVENAVRALYLFNNSFIHSWVVAEPSSHPDVANFLAYLRNCSIQSILADVKRKTKEAAKKILRLGDEFGIEIKLPECYEDDDASFKGLESSLSNKRKLPEDHFPNKRPKLESSNDFQEDESISDCSFSPVRNGTTPIVIIEDDYIPSRYRKNESSLQDEAIEIVNENLKKNPVIELRDKIQDLAKIMKIDYKYISPNLPDFVGIVATGRDFNSICQDSKYLDMLYTLLKWVKDRMNHKDLAYNEIDCLGKIQIHVKKLIQNTPTNKPAVSDACNKSILHQTMPPKTNKNLTGEKYGIPVFKIADATRGKSIEDIRRFVELSVKYDKQSITTVKLDEVCLEILKLHQDPGLLAMNSDYIPPPPTFSTNTKSSTLSKSAYIDIQKTIKKVQGVMEIVENKHKNNLHHNSSVVKETIEPESKIKKNLIPNAQIGNSSSANTNCSTQIPDVFKNCIESNNDIDFRKMYSNSNKSKH